MEFFIISFSLSILLLYREKISVILCVIYWKIGSVTFDDIFFIYCLNSKLLAISLNISFILMLSFFSESECKVLWIIIFFINVVLYELNISGTLSMKRSTMHSSIEGSIYSFYLFLKIRSILYSSISFSCF